MVSVKHLLLAWCVEDAPKTIAIIITTIIISLNYALYPIYQKKKVYSINEFNQVLTSFSHGLKT